MATPMLDSLKLCATDSQPFEGSEVEDASRGTYYSIRGVARITCVARRETENYPLQ
jgi:hypothetical protein